MDFRIIPLPLRFFDLYRFLEMLTAIFSGKKKLTDKWGFVSFNFFGDIYLLSKTVACIANTVQGFLGLGLVNTSI